MEKRESMWDAYLRKGMSRRSFIKGCVALTSLMGLSTDMVSKVVEAAQSQIAAIRSLREQGRLEKLPEKYSQTAALREENPEATLVELAEMFDPPITKSALNHRLRKLVELANEE